MTKIILTKEMKRKQTIRHPFSIFGKNISLPIDITAFTEAPSITVDVEILTIKESRLIKHLDSCSFESFHFDYGLELSDEAYLAYKIFKANTHPVLYGFFEGDREIISLPSMSEIALHAKKLYLLSFIDKEKHLESLSHHNKFILKIAALSITAN